MKRAASSVSIVTVAIIAMMISAVSHASAQLDDRSSTIPAFQKQSVANVLNIGGDTSKRDAATDSNVHYSPLPQRPGVSWARTGIVAGGILSAFTALHIYQSNAWWSNDRSPFHVIEDPDYQADFDKFGHTFGGYYTSHFFDEAYRWAGMDSARASLMGALSGALYEFYVEIEDGFASGWGFSRGDAKGDMAGAAFYLLNQRVPFLRNFRYKWMYTPTDKLLKNHPDEPGHTATFIEDYGGQTYYLSANVHNFLPENLQPYWPKWLNIAAAVSGYDINYPDFARRHKAWYVSLDYDLDKIIPETPWGVLNFLIRGLGYWHFPAPAWRFYPDHKFFWTFPVRINFGNGPLIEAEPTLGLAN
jgi:hypothetical protein